jgi:uncharacterized glyoxalase superfamily protein PhnB
VESLYQSAVEKGQPIQHDLKDQTWGHRSFCVSEPKGLTLTIFSELE